MKFCDKDFLLSNEPARDLFHGTAARQPILDYHCHLSPKDLAEDRRFENIHEPWLGGDHYKWRAMRANGVPEKFITGNETPAREKFMAWAATVPRTLRNPLFHWTHLELRRYFGIETLLDESTAAQIWEQTRRLLAQPGYSARGLVERMNVKVICTTDDPADSLDHHKAIAKCGWKVRVLPAFRPDNALRVHQPDQFKKWVRALGHAAGTGAGTFQGFLKALKARHDFFHENGCRLSDHGLNQMPGLDATAREAAAIFSAALKGRAASPEHADRFASFMMEFFGILDASRGWVKQLHLGALRDPNSRIAARLGADTGCDTMGDFPQAASLARYLDRLDRIGKLPRTILYNVNPADTYAFAGMPGSFQDGSAAGKLQYGAAWWFLDQEEGIRAQINALSNQGLLSRFVGMLTDSRSLLSYPRHEYFRRILCDMIGADVCTGRLPDRRDWLANLVEDVCYRNAKNYFQFPA
ncbi:MAG: glucuronate isomerase [Verrucomicrobia bacterium]|nr:glucuronate isomerase [Verrucomicrobiota bacterium]MDE3099974.1 glucuronate isomerase [Verrucomicrobiota bacterium]